MPRKGRRQSPPRRFTPREQPDLLVLDRFSEADLAAWKRKSEDLDALYRTMYFGLEPERLAKHSQLIDALNERPGAPITFNGWVRMVDVRWSAQPLSSAGSIRSFGGRFNIGADVDESTDFRPFPALYIGDTQETAYREFYQCEQGEDSNGLTPEDLALTRSYSSFRMRGHIERVFDVTDLDTLRPVASVLAKFRTPSTMVPIARRLGVGPAGALLIRTPSKLQETLQDRNWRTWPVQFGLPSPSQKFAELVQAAGYEAIKYRSSKKHGGTCVALLTGNIGTSATRVELMDPMPEYVKHCHLDLENADELAGWEYVRPGHRPKRLQNQE